MHRLRKPTILFFLFLLLRCEYEKQFFPSTYGNHKIKDQVVYGEDNRLDPFEIPLSPYVDLARSTVALLRSEKILHEDIHGLYMSLTPYGQRYNLCTDQKFYHQGTAPYCSGFLISSQRIATAGHCLSARNACRDMRILLDFGLYGSEDIVPDFIPAEKVFYCNRVVYSFTHVKGADLAVIELDRPVKDRPALRLSRQQPAVDTPLVLIGHPSGLPVKIADGGKVLRQEQDFFVTDVDSFTASSGSAIINENSGEVEGILVRGVRDFQYNGTCNQVNVCTPGSCRGEEATNISHVLPYQYENGSIE